MLIEVFMKAIPANNANDAYVTARRAVADRFIDKPLFHSIKVNRAENVTPDPDGKVLYNVHIRAAVE